MSIGEGGGESNNLTVVGPLSVDHISLGGKDWVQLGGPAAYTSLMAAKLGVRVGIVSTFGPEFTNSYAANGELRSQRAEGEISQIGLDDIPCLSTNPGWFHFGPLLNDVTYDAIRGVADHGARISLDPQGYLRRRQSNGLIVEVGDWPERDEILGRVQVLKLNLKEAVQAIGKQVTGKDDLREVAKALYDKIAKALPDRDPKIVLITMGKAGSVLYSDKGFIEIPPREPTELKDPTGAGDVYAGAFLAEYMRTSNAEDSAWFASVASSLAVEELGFKGIQGRKRVKRAVNELRSQTGSIKRDSGTSTQRG